MMSPLSSNRLARARRSFAVASSIFGLAGNRFAGGGAASHALVWAAIKPLVRRNARVISNTEVDHSGKAISSRFAEPGDRNHVSELIWIAPDKIVPAGAPESVRMNGSFAASFGEICKANKAGFRGSSSSG